MSWLKEKKAGITWGAKAPSFAIPTEINFTKIFRLLRCSPNYFWMLPMKKKIVG